MKNILSILLAFTMMSCQNKQENKSETTVISAEEYKKLTQTETPIDPLYAKEILEQKTKRFAVILEGMTFNLPVNYRLQFDPQENTANSYYKFQWKITDHILIDSEAKGFARFIVSNFINYLPSNTEGDFFVIKSNDATLTIDQVLETGNETLYKDKNSAIFKQDGTLRAFYFQYLPKTQQYVFYFSDTPFYNKRPEPTAAEKISQLLNQLRMAKNILKPIDNEKTISYEKQLSIMEKDFFEKLKKETKTALNSNKSLQSFTPSDQGNIPYYTVFRLNTEINSIWNKFNSVSKNGTLTVGEEDKTYQFLRDNSIRYFYPSQYELVSKDNSSLVFSRKSDGSFCLLTKNKDFIVVKVFPALMNVEKSYYATEIDFYKELFTKYN